MVADGGATWNWQRLGYKIRQMIVRFWSGVDGQVDPLHVGLRVQRWTVGSL